MQDLMCDSRQEPKLLGKRATSYGVAHHPFVIGELRQQPGLADATSPKDNA